MHVGRVSAWAAIRITAVTLAGCGTIAGTISGGSATGVVSIGIGEPEHLIPTNAADASGIQVLNALFTPLVVFDRNSKPVPEQAESVTTVDSKAWIIKIKKGYTFHNGE